MTDLRRGVLVKSEDQGEELLSSTAVNGRVVVGGEKGVLRLWEIGVWDDNEEMVRIGRDASADALAAVPEGVGAEPMAALGMDDGFVRFVGMGGKKARVVGESRHDEVEGVVGLGWMSDGRMISGGGAVVKVWEEGIGHGAESEDEGNGVSGVKRANGFGSENDSSEQEEEESSEEEKPRKRKKRKRGKGKDKNGGQHVSAFKGLD